jgi:hypothetical protein
MTWASRSHRWMLLKESRLSWSCQGGRCDIALAAISVCRLYKLV